MTDIAKGRELLVTRILEHEARAPRPQRRAAFDNAGLGTPIDALVDKVARRPYAVTDEDLGGAIASGLTEDQVYELVVCAAVGQATRQYDAALAALDDAAGKK